MKQLHFDLSRRSFSEGGSVMKHSAFTSYDERMKNESFRLQIRNGNDKLRAERRLARAKNRQRQKLSCHFSESNKKSEEKAPCGAAAGRFVLPVFPMKMLQIIAKIPDSGL